MACGELSGEEIARLPTEVALRRLEALPGVGPWTDSLVLLRGFGRMDLFPAGDIGASRGLRNLLGPRAPIAPVVKRAGSRRGYLYFYSLGTRLLKEELIHETPRS